MRILFIGDIVGQPGRRMVARHLKELVAVHRAEIVLANAENAAAGFGITPSVGEELFGLGSISSPRGTMSGTRRKPKGTSPGRAGSCDPPTIRMRRRASARTSSGRANA